MAINLQALLGYVQAAKAMRQQRKMARDEQEFRSSEANKDIGRNFAGAALGGLAQAGSATLGKYLGEQTEGGKAGIALTKAQTGQAVAQTAGIEANTSATRQETDFKSRDREIRRRAAMIVLGEGAGPGPSAEEGPPLEAGDGFVGPPAPERMVSEEDALARHAARGQLRKEGLEDAEAKRAAFATASRASVEAGQAKRLRSPLKLDKDKDSMRAGDYLERAKYVSSAGNGAGAVAKLKLYQTNDRGQIISTGITFGEYATRSGQDLGAIVAKFRDGYYSTDGGREEIRRHLVSNTPEAENTVAGRAAATEAALESEKARTAERVENAPLALKQRDLAIKKLEEDLKKLKSGEMNELDRKRYEKIQLQINKMREGDTKAKEKTAAEVVKERATAATLAERQGGVKARAKGVSEEDIEKVRKAAAAEAEAANRVARAKEIFIRRLMSDRGLTRDKAEEAFDRIHARKGSK